MQNRPQVRANEVEPCFWDWLQPNPRKSRDFIGGGVSLPWLLPLCKGSEEEIIVRALK